MAEYRTIRMAFWNDPFVEELEAEEKLLYLYLFTCPHTNNLGILEVSRRKIAFETGLDVETVNAGLQKLEKAGKIVTDAAFILLTRFIRHQTTTSPKIAQALKGMLAGVSSGKLRHALCLGYPSIFDAQASSGYPIDTVSIGYHNHTDTVSIPYSDPIHTVGIPPAEEEEEREEEDNSTLTSFECLSESAPLPDAPASEPEEKNPRIDLDRPDPHTRPGEIPCPHKRIIEVYEAILPELPRVRVWRARQAADLRARWREKLREGKFSDEESGVDYFRRFFGYVRRSEFLMGRRSGRDGRTFRNCLAWMVKAKNFDGIVDGKYHDQEAA
ncbi:hypothetical protein QUW42_09290 [Desulfovibrio piger]|uniref:helix-turn-helix domain-containing protein n=1 Tax=Desulfovibrio piger TaxID=901 RepID=UPI0025A4263F|nr:helix-turn-helix domain-containing protein [Desulfovibrio piger]MDM8330473.1 hypothetical protein [Desulfovibrio piger]